MIAPYLPSKAPKRDTSKLEQTLFDRYKRLEKINYPEPIQLLSREEKIRLNNQKATFYKNLSQITSSQKRRTTYEAFYRVCEEVSRQLEE